MNQALELDILSGFNPKSYNHLLWVIRSHFERVSKEANLYNNKAATELDPILKDNYRERCQKALGAALELKALSDMLDNKTIPAWYCSRCGILDAEEVTNTGRCSKCGGALPF